MSGRCHEEVRQHEDLLHPQVGSLPPLRAAWIIAGADRDLTRETPTADSEWIEAILEKNEVDHDVLMDAVIDEASKTPLFRQIMEQVIGLVDSHALKLGTRLPSTRALAERLGVDRSTVYKAYQELWALGYLDSRPGSYSTVRHLRSM